MEKDYIQLKKEFVKLPEAELFNRLSHFKIILDLVATNYDEFVRHLDYMNETPFSYIQPTDEDFPKYDSDLKKAHFVVHNYVTSVYTLIDNARNFYRGAVKKFNKFHDYEEEASRRFERNEVSKFVHDLRRCFQHCMLLSFSVSVTPDSAKPLTLTYRKDDLLKFTGWSSYSKRYIAKEKDRIDLCKSFSEFQLLSTEFYDWFIRKIEYTHDQEKRFLEYKRSEYLHASLKELPLWIRFKLDLLKDGFLERPEEMFKDMIPKTDYDRILVHNLIRSNRAKAFIRYFEGRMIILPEWAKKEITEAFHV